MTRLKKNSHSSFLFQGKVKVKRMLKGRILMKRNKVRVRLLIQLKEELVEWMAESS